MTVFIDYIFLENIVFSIIILIQTKLLARVELNKKRMIVASFVNAIYVCIMLVLKLDILNYFWCKLLLSFASIYLAFKPENIGKYLKLVGIYYLATIVNVGTCVAVNQMLNIDTENFLTKIVVYLISLIITYVYTKEFWKIYKNNININKLICSVEFAIGGRSYSYDGFIDTGNTVQSYELGVPVVFAEYINEEQKYLVKKLPQYEVPVSTISKKSSEKVVLIKGATISNKRIDIGVVFVEKKLNKDNKYNLILNYSIFEENLGGISL